MLEIREYREADHDAVWILHNDALTATGAHAGDGPWDDDLHNIFEHFINRGGIFLVGLLQEKLVARGALRRVDSTTGEIKRMRGAPDQQRRGYGTVVRSSRSICRRCRSRCTIACSSICSSV